MRARPVFLSVSWKVVAPEASRASCGAIEPLAASVGLAEAADNVPQATHTSSASALATFVTRLTAAPTASPCYSPLRPAIPAPNVVDLRVGAYPTALGERGDPLREERVDDRLL